MTMIDPVENSVAQTLWRCSVVGECVSKAGSNEGENQDVRYDGQWPSGGIE
jgi:hypothetical protein